MNLLITGGLGFIGSAVVRRLLSATDEVVVNVDRMTYAASPESLGNWLRHPRRPERTPTVATLAEGPASHPAAPRWGSSP